MALRVSVVGSSGPDELEDLYEGIVRRAAAEFGQRRGSAVDPSSGKEVVVSCGGITWVGRR